MIQRRFQDEIIFFLGIKILNDFIITKTADHAKISGFLWTHFLTVHGYIIAVVGWTDVCTTRQSSMKESIHLTWIGHPWYGHTT